MKSLKFLDQLKNEQELKNDVAICKLLGWSSGQISQYRSGKRIMDNEACLALALELKIDPLLVIMAADIDRAERSGQHSLWEVFSRRATQTASIALFGAVTLFVTPTPSEAAPALKANNDINLYYVKQRRQLTILRTVFASLKRLLSCFALQAAAS